jgi:phage shock protein A
MSNYTLEQRVAQLEAELAQLKQSQQNAEAEEPWWKRIVGIFADSPEFEAAVEKGRAYRESLAAIENTTASEAIDLT